MPPRRVGKLTDVERSEVVQRYLAGESLLQLANAYGVTEPSIRGLLVRRKVPLRKVVHTLREDAFDRLTPEACYWIGFLFADGSVCYRQGHKPQISVGLAARDRDHLVALRNFLGSTSAISEPTPERQACQFSVRSFQLCDRLLSLGRYDDRVDDALRASRDFWRGVTDGDGSIGSYKRSSSSIRCLSQFRLVGRRPVLEAFAAFSANARD